MQTNEDLFEQSLDSLGVTLGVSNDEMALIPPEGPLLIAANHPHGMLDGLLLAAAVSRVRTDVKILANTMLGMIPELREHLITVDPYGGPEAHVSNIGAMRAAAEWLRQRGALIVFPAGDVAHLRLSSRSVDESEWSPTVARLIRRFEATVVPAFIDGRNSSAFQFLGLLHPRVRTALMVRELLNKRGSTIWLRLGTPIPVQTSKRRESAASLTGYMRFRTFLLGRTHSAAPPVPPNRTLAPVAAPEPIENVRREIGEQGEFELVRAGPLRVYCCPAARIPRALREIGRLRECTFRAVGEGSGLSIDLDRFDSYYQHLLLWDDERGQVAGAYRLGLTDEIVAQFGISGLYTNTLFRYGKRLLRQLGPAVELGRSFVTPEYQRSYAALLLLWKGIAAFVRLNPRYRVLLGAVSISAEYDSMTKRLLMAFLRANHRDRNLSGLVIPRRPPRFPRLRPAETRLLKVMARTIDDAESLVREIEQNRRGVPVLVRQYLQLNAKLLGFNIDREFGDVLDGLFYVDLTRVDKRVLARYMGLEAAEAFLSAHALPVAQSLGTYEPV
ncbi:MAG: lysophospholipid acyltransferase family protein [Phycisphaerae bacterium]|nr:lysophospholipid acyltransferase family protein [Phycisphaerae bacterium]